MRPTASGSAFGSALAQGSWGEPDYDVIGERARRVGAQMQPPVTQVTRAACVALAAAARTVTRAIVDSAALDAADASATEAAWTGFGYGAVAGEGGAAAGAAGAAASSAGGYRPLPPLWGNAGWSPHLRWDRRRKEEEHEQLRKHATEAKLGPEDEPGAEPGAEMPTDLRVGGAAAGAGAVGGKRRGDLPLSPPFQSHHRTFFRQSSSVREAWNDHEKDDVHASAAHAEHVERERKRILSAAAARALLVPLPCSPRGPMQTRAEPWYVLCASAFFATCIPRALCARAGTCCASRATVGVSLRRCGSCTSSIRRFVVRCSAHAAALGQTTPSRWLCRCLTATTPQPRRAA